MAHPQVLKVFPGLALYLLTSFIDIVFYEDFPLWAIARRNAGGLDMQTDQLGNVMLWNGLFCIPTPFTVPYLCRLFPFLTLYRILAVLWMGLMFSLPFIHYIPRESTSSSWILVLWMIVRVLLMIKIVLSCLLKEEDVARKW